MLGFKREIVSVMKLGDYIEANLACQLSVASNVLSCCTASVLLACVSVKEAVSTCHRLPQNLKFNDNMPAQVVASGVRNCSRVRANPAKSRRRRPSNTKSVILPRCCTMRQRQRATVYTCPRLPQNLKLKLNMPRWWRSKLVPQNPGDLRILQYYS